MDLATLFEITGRTTKSNLPQDVPLKWNVEKGGAQFWVGNATLRKALVKNSAEPDANGLFATRQIGASVYGGALSEEKLRRFAAIADAISSRIMASELSRAAKEDLLKDLSSIPVCAAITAETPFDTVSNRPD